MTITKADSAYFSSFTSRWSPWWSSLWSSWSSFGIYYLSIMPIVIPIGAPNTKSIKDIRIFRSFKLAYLDKNELPVEKDKGSVWITVEMVRMIIYIELSFTPIAIPSVSWWKKRNAAKANWEDLFCEDLEVWVCWVLETKSWFLKSF